MNRMFYKKVDINYFVSQQQRGGSDSLLPLPAPLPATPLSVCPPTPAPRQVFNSRPTVCHYVVLLCVH